jgi:hypothetical protein
MGATTMNAAERLAVTVADAAMRAAVAMVRARGAKLTDAQLDGLVVALREESLAAYDRVIADGKALVAGGGAGWAGALVGVAAYDAAKAALARVLGA